MGQLLIILRGFLSLGVRAPSVPHESRSSFFFLSSPRRGKSKDIENHFSTMTLRRLSLSRTSFRIITYSPYLTREREREGERSRRKKSINAPRQLNRTARLLNISH